MKKFRKVLLLALLLFVSFGIIKVEAKEKVKVYIFEAGGCPYCEAQVEYLEGLSSYGEKFVIVRKELYVDHIDWERGKDYELGRTVANAFYAAGFNEASYNGTPFVVISDIYAVAGYSTNLETVIEEAYNRGDKDVVGCYEKGNSDCLNTSDTSTTNDDAKKDDTKVDDSKTDDRKDDSNTETYGFAETSSGEEKSESNVGVVLLIVFLSMSVILNVVFIILLVKKK